MADNSEKEIVEALTMALDLEKNGLKTYLDYARLTRDVGGKDLFILLARDEYDHMSVIEDLLTAYVEKGEWPRIQIEESIIEKIMPKMEDIDNFTHSGEGMNRMHAIEMALKFETRSRDIYQNLANKTKDDIVCDLFLGLVAIEEAHYNILNLQKNSITKTGMWLEIADIGMEHLL